MNSKVDFFFQKDSAWKTEYSRLRNIVLDCGLTEDSKWGCPCYTFKNNNVVLIHGFKEYCALQFHKGALLNDQDDILIQQTKNVQSARQMRFTDVDQINSLASIIKKYIYEAIEVEKLGSKVEFKKTQEYEVPEEFKKKLEEYPEVKAAFESLTPGRQRGYLLYFSQAKQSKTREARIEKHLPNILDGKGLND